MFNKIEPLEHSKHQDLRLTKTSGFTFAKDISAVKLSFSELRHASRFYPIVFLNNAPGIPQALLSLEIGKNACVDEAGNWKVPYIPAYFRLYPFTLAKIQEQEDKFALCLDPEAEHFKSGMGDPLFTADGAPTEFVQKNILNFLQVYQQELKTTQALFNALEEKELIVDKAFKYTLNQTEKSINGFKGVDMEKLTALDDKSLADMVKNGTMGLVYEHTHSLSNFSNFLAPAPAAPKG
ncbi:SapC family protein [Desulfobacula phenolica]|uniref:SapC protein n=1 Tax=Desulfobacula phenolica TaxID=90732 RepID=A0A1H2DPK4_9BACT|nr:SapC family protein [Desulfobacula phenolica]SDT84704.1 SapC protein [Desulfobacula phenolica]